MGLALISGGPPKGWNSFDCYGVLANAAVLAANLELFAERLAPSGYEYFVVDAGWYYVPDAVSGTGFPKAEDIPGMAIAMDGFGRPRPSEYFFPHGFAPLIERCHQLGVKFGVHIMRGVPRRAADAALPVSGGGGATCADIADHDRLCPWCDLNYGVDMSKPGAQAYYDSLVAMLAEWGVDFIKADDIVPYPDEVAALVEAVEKAPREIALSLSPGDRPLLSAMEVYRKANMLRVSHDIWDCQAHIDDSFERWEMFQGMGGDNFWIDLDMIPFGRLCVWRGGEVQGEGEALLAGKGGMRMSGLGLAQRQSFMAMRAMASSPLFMGGDLTHTDEESFQLLTNPAMLECHRLARDGRLLNRKDDIDVWAASGGAGQGWVGVFNRSGSPKSVSLDSRRLGLPSAPREFFDVWKGGAAIPGLLDREIHIPAWGVAFIKHVSKEIVR